MSSRPPGDKGEKPTWLDNPKNVDRIVYALFAICVVVQVADLFYHKHVHYSWEGYFGFYGWYGFVSCVFLVLAATAMRKLVMRGEDYYDD